MEYFRLGMTFLSPSTNYMYHICLKGVGFYTCTCQDFLNKFINIRKTEHITSRFKGGRAVTFFFFKFMRVKERRGSDLRALYSFGPFCIPSAVVN